MLKSSLTRKIVSLFMIWLAILLPVELSEALSFTSAPSVSDLKPDGATVKWISDQQATGTAYYGEGSPTNTVSEQEASIVHEIQLTGLTPSTTYYFYASMTAGGVETTNDNQGNYFTFTTAEPADVNPPHAPVDLKTTLVGHSSIALSWTSSTEDGDVDSYNVYLNGEKQTNTKSRTYQNSNLEPETSYKFEISAVDTSGNEGPKAQLDVSTISEHVRPITVGQIKTEVLGTDAIFSWDTDYPTNALLKYGTTPMTLDQSTSLQNYNQSHQINLTGLQPNTTYTYEVNACDIYNNCRNKTGTIQTAEDVPLFLELSSPAINSSEPDEVYYHNSFEIDIIGRAAAYSDVSVSVNGKKARFKRIREDQTFQFNGISLDRDANSTLLEIVAKGRKGGEMRIARQVSVDRHTPDVTDFFMPSFTAESSFYVSGNLTDQTDVVAKMYILKDALAFHVEKDENDDFPDWYLQQGEQTRMTKEVKDAAAAIEDKATDRETVQAILDWTRNLNACDTAPQSRSRPSKAIITSGCAADSVDYALAFVAVARQKGIPAKYVETVEAEWAACVSEYGMDDPQCKEKKEHVFSEVWLEDEWAAVDPSAGAFTEKDDKGHFRSSEYQDSTMLTLAYGRDSWGIGIDNEGGFKDKMEQAVAQGTSAEKVKVFIKEEEIFRNGPFNLSFGPLEEGKDNDVVIDFVDQAGNVLNFEKLITYDTTPPKIISPSDLSAYTPSYVYEIKISGQVDDIATVYAFVNEENINDLGNADSEIRTDDKGNFQVPVTLDAVSIKGAVSADSKDSKVGGKVGLGVTSKVVLVAVDDAGQRSDPIEGDITFGQCSEGAWWKVTTTDFSPSRLNTRELMKGIASFGFAFNLSWQGGGDSRYATVSSVTIRSAPIGSAYTDEQFDRAEDFISTQVALSQNKTGGARGIILANFKPVQSEGNTTYEKEVAISDRGKNTKKCTIPGVGCFHFLLMMEISFLHSHPEGTGDQPKATYQEGAPEQKAGLNPPSLQKHCIPVEIIVDERVDPSVIPNEFLEAAIDVLNSTINFIEMVLGPLTIITKVVLIGCLVMWIAVFVTNIQKQFACKWGSIFSKPSITGIIKSAANMDDFTHAAEQGLCEVLYPDDDPKLKEVQDACTACGESVNTYWKTRWAHRFLCDRVICPSVPTFQHYVQQKGGGRSRLGVALNLKTSDKYKSISSIANFIEPTDVNQGQGVTSEKGPNIPNQLDIKHDCQLVEQRGAREIKKLYTAYNQNKDELKDECSGPHPYQPQCCAAAYMNDWNWGAVFIDPLKQSMCLANPSDDECGLGARVVNGIVGICEPNNKQSRLQTAENMRYTPEFTRAMPTEPEGHVVYLIEYDSDGKLTRVVRGYIKRQYDLQPGEATVGKEFVPVVSNQGFMEDSPNLADAFDKINPADPDSEEPADDKAYQIFAQDLKQNSLGGEREIIIKNPYARRKYSSTPSTAAGTSSGGAALPGAGTSGTTGGTSGGGTASSGTTVPGATGKTVAKITGAAGEKDGKTDEKDAKAGDAKADSKGAKAGDAKANDKGAKAGDAKANDKKSEKANGNDFGDYASGLKGDKCPSERKIPNYARTKYGGKECCADKMIWKQSLGACKFVCPPEQQRQDDRTLCCPNGQVWSRDKNGCTASTYGHEFGKGDIPKYKLKDEDIRAAYYRISGEVGTVSQTYVLKPSSSFTQALIALCLTAIRRYLIQILRIMKQLKMCFESILYTGDGSAGQCEAIISQYICDLIIEAISCFMRRFGSSGPTGEDSSGIGNFMGAVSDSSDEVLGDITDRYGDQNVFTDQFSTSSIAKGACIFAFTGEWPSNFGSLLDSAIDIPIQSFSSVYPAERRFVAYDLEGNAIFNYHVALSFFSGAPTRARLELVCSGADVQCPEDGRQFAKCDCAENGEQTYQVQLSQCEPSCPDAYSQDQDCTTECFIRMEHSKVRYDRARFVWDWTGSRQTQGIAGPALGQTAAKPGDLSGKQEKEITEIQGPPFDLCHFDATELRYRCGFGSTTDDYARIADVRLAEPPDQQEGQQPLFKVGDYHILNMDIIQKTPEKEMERCGLGDCKSTKYLSVVIRNQGGAVVWPKGYNPVSTSVPGAVPVGVQPDKSKPPAATSNPVSLPPALKLNGNSRHQLAFFDIIDFESFTQATDKFEITREMFTVSPTKRKAKTSSGSGVNNPSKSCYSQSCAISGLACDENTVPKSKIGTDQGLQLIVSKDKITYRPVRIVQKGSGPIKLDPIDGAPAQNCEHKNGKLKCGDSTFLLSDKVKIESLVTGKKSVACTVYFKDRSKKAEKPASLPGVSTGGTLPGACTSQPQTWTAEVTLWDAQKDGTSYRMSPQVSVAPDGQVNRKNIAFKVACAERQGEYESEYTKISQIGARSASYTVEKHHDYGIDARRMEGDETVTIANYRRIGPVDFEVDILVEAMIVDLNIDVGVEGLDANSPELKISKTGVKNPLPRCKMDDPNNPQPRPCYTTTKDGKYLNLYLRRGDPRYTFEGFISSEVYRAEEGTACRAPYEDGVCAYDEMWDCVAEGGSEVAGLNPSASGIPVRTDEIHLITGILENKTLVYGFVKNQSGKSDGFEKVMFYNSDDQAVTGVVNITAVSEGLTMYAGKFFTVRSGSLVSSPLDKYDDAKALLTAGKRSYLGQGACDGQNCCGVGETKCCPTGKLVPKYKDSEAQSCKKEGTPALCISNEFTCIEGEPNKVKATRPYGFGTGEGKNQKLKTKQCPGSSVCCPTGNYKKERRKVAKASFSGVGGGVKTPEKESTVSNKIPAGTSGGACMDTKDCKCAYTCPTEMKYDTPDYSDCKEGLTPCRTVKESGKLGGACVGQTVEECVCAIPDDCDQGYPGINLCSGGATPCKKMKTQGPLGTKKLPGYPNVYCGKEGLGGNVFNYEGLNNNCQALMPSHPGVYYNAYCTGPVSQLNDNQACPSNACCACKGTVIPAGGCCNADNPGAPCEGPADVYMGGTKVTEFTDYGEVCDKDYCFCGTTTPRKDKVTTKGSCCKFWVQTKDNCPSGVPMPCGCNGPAWEKCFYCPK